LALSTPAR